MIAFLKRMWKAAPVAVVILTVSLMATGFFGVRIVDRMLRPPPPRDVVIEPWMTPRFVAHSWRIPRPVIVEALQYEAKDGRPPNLRQIAEDRGMTVDALIADLETAIAAHRAEKETKRD